MSDTFITAMSIMVMVILIFFVSILSIVNQNDEITQTSVEAIIANFVNTVAREGKITPDSYDDFIQKLYATGNSYDINIEVQIMHNNVINNNEKTIGENIYYSIFKNEIESKLNNGESYKLKQGDRIIVKTKNNNVTFGTQLKNFIYSIAQKDTIVIEATNSALVTTNGK